MRYEHSIALTKRARAATPGAAQTLSRRPERFPEGAFPAFLTRGDGARVWDVDGHESVDWIGGLASLTLGYAHPHITEAVIRQARDGCTFSLPHRLEAEVSERFCATVGQEQVRWLKTGSEAAEAAIRTARIATGREFTISIGYHSWASWYAALQPNHPGTPDALRTIGEQVAYNDLIMAEDLARRYRKDLAAIFVEPVLIEAPAPGYLEGLRRLADDTGALLIFDEVVTGFRWHLRGGAGYFGVQPDLQIFGKAIGGGYPLACLVGPERLMRHAWPVSGTFGGEAVSLAACNAVMDVYEREPVIERLWGRGGQLTGWADSCGYGILPELHVRGHAPHPVWSFGDHPQAVALMSLWLQETARRGVLYHPGGMNPQAVLTEADMAVTRAANEGAARVLREALDTGTVEARLEGALIQANPLRVTR